MRVNIFFYIFIMPALIVFYALWQYWRVSDIIDLAWHAHSAEAAGIIFRSLLAKTGIMLGVLAIVVSALAMGLCHTSAISSRKSQDQLIKMFSRCQKLLPFIMVAQMILCGLAVISLALSELVWGFSHIKLNGGSAKVLLIIVCGIGSIFWMLLKSLLSLKKCFALFHATDNEIRGRNITREQAPALWRWIEELAVRGNVVIPDNIVTGFFDCFYVTANAVRIIDGERVTGNTLYFPLTYASLMSKDEVAAVIGHELGHFTGKDTEYSLRFAPLYAGLRNNLEQMAGNARGVSYTDKVVLYPSLYMGCWFLEKFHETVSYWSRLREHAADEAGARTGTPLALASALLRISALSDIIWQHITLLLDNKVPQENWVATLLEAAKIKGSLDVNASVENEVQHPTDSHPLTRLRLEALHIPIDETLLLLASRPASEEDYQSIMSLFTGSQDIFVAMTQEIAHEVSEQKEKYYEEQALQATRNVESFTFYGAGNTLWMWSWGLGVLCVATAFIFLLLTIGSFTGIAITVILGLLAFGLLLCFGGWTMFRNRNKALFSIDRQFLSSEDLAEPVALTDIVTCEVAETAGGAFNIHFYWRDGAPVPAMAETSSAFSDVDISAGKQRISISVTGYLRREEGNRKVSMNAAQTQELLNGYFISAYARQEINSD